MTRSLIAASMLVLTPLSGTPGHAQIAPAQGSIEPGGAAPPISFSDDETSGDVVMNGQRQLFIYYDDHPDVAVASFPGEPGYRLYLELAPGIEPGRRQRLAKAVAMFERGADGSYSVFRYIEAEDGTAEPGVDRIDPDNREYDCYHGVLGRLDGGMQHYLLLSDQRAIRACVDRPPTP